MEPKPNPPAGPGSGKTPGSGSRGEQGFPKWAIWALVGLVLIAGLVAAGLHPSPVPYADFVTTTTHKTLRGPRSGLIMCKEQYAKDLDRTVFPGIQGGPLVHIIAAKAVAFREALQPEFKTYQQQVIRNASALAGFLAEVVDGRFWHDWFHDAVLARGFGGVGHAGA